MKISEWFCFGYGPKEFQRDAHAFWVIVSGWLIVDLPHIQKLTAAEWKDHAILALAMAAVAVLKSWATPTPNSQPADKPQGGQ